MVLRMWVALQARIQTSERGAVASEYAILLALIAVVLVTAITGLRNAIAGAIDDAADAITG